MRFLAAPSLFFLLVHVALALRLERRAPWLGEAPKFHLPPDVPHPVVVKPPSPSHPITPNPNPNPVFPSPTHDHLAPPKPIKDPSTSRPPGSPPPGFHPGGSPLRNQPLFDPRTFSLAEYLARYPDAGPYILKIALEEFRRRALGKNVAEIQELASDFQQTRDLVNQQPDRLTSAFTHGAPDVKRTPGVTTVAPAPRQAGALTRVADAVQALQAKSGRAWTAVTSAIRKQAARLRSIFMRRRPAIQPPETPYYTPGSPASSVELPDPGKWLPFRPGGQRLQMDKKSGPTIDKVQNYMSELDRLGLGIVAESPERLNNLVGEKWLESLLEPPTRPFTREVAEQRTEFANTVTSFLVDLKRYSGANAALRLEDSALGAYVKKLGQALGTSIDTNVEKAVTAVVREKLPDVLRGPGLVQAQRESLDRIKEVWETLTPEQRHTLLTTSHLSDADETRFLAQAADPHLDPSQVDEFLGWYTNEKKQDLQSLVNGQVRKPGKGDEPETPEAIKANKQRVLELTYDQLLTKLKTDPQFAPEEMINDIADFKATKAPEQWANTLHAQIATHIKGVVSAGRPTLREDQYAAMADKVFSDIHTCRIVTKKIFGVESDFDPLTEGLSDFMNHDEVASGIESSLAKKNIAGQLKAAAPDEVPPREDEPESLLNFIDKVNIRGTPVGEAIIQTIDGAPGSVKTAESVLAELKPKLTPKEFEVISQDLAKTNSLSQCYYALKQLRDTKFVNFILEEVNKLPQASVEAERKATDSYLLRAKPSEVRKVLHQTLPRRDYQEAFGFLAETANKPLTAEERAVIHARRLADAAIPEFAGHSPYRGQEIFPAAAATADNEALNKRATDVFYDLLGSNDVQKTLEEEVKRLVASEKQEPLPRSSQHASSPGQAVQPDLAPNVQAALLKYPFQQLALYQKPLQVGDVRLKGTPFEFLDPQIIPMINSEARHLYENWRQLVQKVFDREAGLAGMSQKWDNFFAEAMNQQVSEVLEKLAQDRQIKPRPKPGTRPPNGG